MAEVVEELAHNTSNEKDFDIFEVPKKLKIEMSDSIDKIKMLDEYLENGKPIYSHKSYGEECPTHEEEIPETERGLMRANTGLEPEDK